MQIVPLTNDRSLADIAARVYGLKPKDKRIAQASKALAVANPQLRDDPRQLPAGTPIAVPTLPGLNVASTDRVDPRHDAMVALLHRLGDSVQQASAAQLGDVATADGNPGASMISRQTSAAASQQTPARAAALDLLHADLAAFLKLHG